MRAASEINSERATTTLASIPTTTYCSCKPVPVQGPIPEQVPRPLLDLFHKRPCFALCSPVHRNANVEQKDRVARVMSSAMVLQDVQMPRSNSNKSAVQKPLALNILLPNL